jgi:hypothetical protein
MDVYDVRAAKHSRYHFGYTGALEDAEHMTYEEREYALDRANNLAAANRRKGNINAAHLYEGKAKGFEDALTGL